VKFVIHATALNSDDSALALIDRLVDRLADEVHRVDIPDADLLEASRWYQNARQTRQKVLMSAVAGPPRKASPMQGPHVKVVEVESPESVRLAEKLAHAPLVVLVEDREADGVLLDMVVEELGWPTLRALWERAREVTPRAIEIDTAGGVSAIPRRVERAASDADGENRPLRHFVLFDSDSRWPGDNDVRVTQPMDAVRRACKEHNVPYHRWRKRCAENYIPDQVFEAAREDPRNLSYVDRFNALLRRSRVQRDYFPVKDGLTAMERSAALRAGLYNAAEEEDLRLLETRLFPRRLRPLLRLSRERRGSFTADGLRERDGEGELDALLRAIAEEL
jgi:hypothetical protein